MLLSMFVSGSRKSLGSFCSFIIDFFLLFSIICIVKTVVVEVKSQEETRTNYSGNGLLFRKCSHSNPAGRDDDHSS
jgi:hypothetical protein